MTEFFNRTAEKEKRRLLRNNATVSEVLLWGRLKGKRVCGQKFRRQYSVGPYILDFYCPAVKLAVEIDGGIHFRGDAPEYDRDRQRYIETFGIHVLRFTNEDVQDNLTAVLKAIEQDIRLHLPEPPDG